MAAFNSEYVLDGFDLTEENQRWFVMEGTSIPELGAPSLPSVTVPGRWGVLPLPVHGYGTSQITLKMMVTDARDGVIGKGGRQRIAAIIEFSPGEVAGVVEKSTSVRVTCRGEPDTADR